MKKYNKYFQFAVTVALNHQRIKTDPWIITKIKPFINTYNWKAMNFPTTTTNDWKKFGKNNRTIALNILSHKNEKI